MVLPRALYVTFYVLYLVVMALVLWFMVHYTDIPAWIYILLVVPLAIFVIGLAVKETVMKGQLYPDGTTTYHLNGGWVIFYIIAHIAAFIMFGTGIVLAMANDSQHWWGWLLFGMGFLMTILATMLLTLLPKRLAWAIVVAVLGYIMMIAGAIIVLFFAQPEWWGWTILAVAVILGVLAFVFELMVEENVMPAGCGPYPCPTVVAPSTTTIITTPNALQTTTTFQQGNPEYMVVHTGEVDAAGRPQYVVVHNTPHPGQQTSRIAVTGTPVVVPAPAPIVVQQPPPVVVQQPRPVVVQQPRPVVVQQPQPVTVQQPQPVVVQPGTAIATTTTNYRAPAEPQRVMVPQPPATAIAATRYQAPAPQPVMVPAPQLVLGPAPIATTTTNYRDTALAAPVLPAASPMASPMASAPPTATATATTSNLISVSGPAGYSPATALTAGQYPDNNIEITQGFVDTI
jgi:hypothetical protein